MVWLRRRHRLKCRGCSGVLGLTSDEMEHLVGFLPREGRVEAAPKDTAKKKRSEVM